MLQRKLADLPIHDFQSKNVNKVIGNNDRAGGFSVRFQRLKIEREPVLVFPDQDRISFIFKLCTYLLRPFSDDQIKCSCVDFTRANLRVNYEFDNNSLERKIRKQKIPA